MQKGEAITIIGWILSGIGSLILIFLGVIGFIVSLFMRKLTNLEGKDKDQDQKIDKIESKVDGLMGEHKVNHR